MADPCSLSLSRGNLSPLCSLRTGKSQTDPAPNFGVSFKCLKVDEMNQSLDLHTQVQIWTQILRDI